MNVKALKALLAEVTQGYWSAGHYGAPTSVHSASRRIASTGGHSDGGDITQRENKANARLIAMAPALARRVIAAEKLVEALQREVDDEMGSLMPKAASRLEAALAEWEAAQ